MTIAYSNGLSPQTVQKDTRPSPGIQASRTGANLSEKFVCLSLFTYLDSCDLLVSIEKELTGAQRQGNTAT